MKVLVIGGMHGNEPLGPAVVKLCDEKPIKDVNTLIANQPALTADRRFIGEDLNRSFPGSTSGVTYEARRAAELLELCKLYDVVLDFHNTHCPGNDCGFVGQAAPQQLYDAAAFLGLSRVVVADYDCINKYATNCVSVEISLNSPEMSPAVWYEKIVSLSRLSAIPNSGEIKKFRFVYRMSLEDKESLSLEQANLKAFVPIASELANAMKVKNPAYPIFVADEYTPYNYGGLLNEL